MVNLNNTLQNDRWIEPLKSGLLSLKKPSAIAPTDQLTSCNNAFLWESFFAFFKARFCETLGTFLLTKNFQMFSNFYFYQNVSNSN